jgi:hypothetical protein
MFTANNTTQTSHSPRKHTATTFHHPNSNKQGGLSVSAPQPKVSALEHITLIDLTRNIKTPGLEQVMFSRTMELGCMSIYDASEISIKMICDIGKRPAYENHRAFEQTLRQLSTEKTSP